MYPARQDAPHTPAPARSAAARSKSLAARRREDLGDVVRQAGEPACRHLRAVAAVGHPQEVCRPALRETLSNSACCVRLTTTPHARPLWQEPPMILQRLNRLQCVQTICKTTHGQSMMYRRSLQNNHRQQAPPTHSR